MLGNSQFTSQISLALAKIYVFQIVLIWRKDYLVGTVFKFVLKWYICHFFNLCMWISLIAGQSTTPRNETPTHLLEIKKKVGSKWKAFLLKFSTKASKIDQYEVLPMRVCRK